MDALKTGAIEPARTTSASEPRYRQQLEPRLIPRIKAALAVLLEALEYGRDLDRNAWDFAVEISVLRRLKLSNSDMRWMVGKGLVEHAIEVTLNGDLERSFRQPTRLLFCKRTCFVLAPSGVALAHEICQPREPDPPANGHSHADAEPRVFGFVSAEEAVTPRWDRDRQELKVGNTVITRFKVPAVDQETILGAFEDANWSVRIDNPLPRRGERSPKQRLQETVESLNRNQKQPLLQFLSDAGGGGVRWEFRNKPAGSAGA